MVVAVSGQLFHVTGLYKAMYSLWYSSTNHPFEHEGGRTGSRFFVSLASMRSAVNGIPTAAVTRACCVLPSGEQNTLEFMFLTSLTMFRVVSLY